MEFKILLYWWPVPSHVVCCVCFLLPPCRIPGPSCITAPPGRGHFLVGSLGICSAPCRITGHLMRGSKWYFIANLHLERPCYAVIAKGGGVPLPPWPLARAMSISFSLGFNFRGLIWTTSSPGFNFRRVQIDHFWHQLCTAI